MAQKQFDAFKKHSLTRKMAHIVTPEELLISAASYYVDLFSNGQKTPFDSFFTAAQKASFTNERISTTHYSHATFAAMLNLHAPDRNQKKHKEKPCFERSPYTHLDNFLLNGYSKTTSSSEELFNELRILSTESHLENTYSNLCSPTTPAPITQFKVLLHCDIWYESKKTGSKETFFELAQDFRDFYSALIEHLAAMPGLESLKNAKKNDFFKPLYPLKDLAANGVPNYPATFEAVSPEGFSQGIAIIQEASYPSCSIESTLDSLDAATPLGSSFIRNSSTIEEWRFRLQDALAECFAREKAFDIVEGFIKVPDVHIFSANNNMREKIAALNNLFELINGAVLAAIRAYSSPHKTQVQAFMPLLQPITLAQLEPTQKAVEQASATVSYETFQGASDLLIEGLKATLYE